MATKIPAGDDPTTEMQISGKTKLAELQAAVDGLIEFVQFSDGSALIVNEEGKLRDMPLNERASAITILKGRPEHIAGPALFLSRAELRALDEWEG